MGGVERGVIIFGKKKIGKRLEVPRARFRSTPDLCHTAVSKRAYQTLRDLAFSLKT